MLGEFSRRWWWRVVSKQALHESHQKERWTELLPGFDQHILDWNKWFLGGGFKYLLFSPLLGEDFQFNSYFSDGLVQPPTRFHGFLCLEGILGKWGRNSQMFGGNDSSILSHIFVKWACWSVKKNDGWRTLLYDLTTTTDHFSLLPVNLCEFIAHTHTQKSQPKMTRWLEISGFFFLGGRCISSRLAFISLGSTKKKVRSSWGVSTEQVQQGNSISKSKKIGKTFGEYFLLRRMGGKEHITIFFQMGVTTRRIIPVSKWLITAVSKSPKKG